MVNGRGGDRGPGRTQHERVIRGAVTLPGSANIVICKGDCVGNWEIPRLSQAKGRRSASGRREAKADDARARDVAPRHSSCEAGEKAVPRMRECVSQALKRKRQAAAATCRHASEASGTCINVHVRICTGRGVIPDPSATIK